MKKILALVGLCLVMASCGPAIHIPVSQLTSDQKLRLFDSDNVSATGTAWAWNLYTFNERLSLLTPPVTILSIQLRGGNANRDVAPFAVLLRDAEGHIMHLVVDDSWQNLRAGSILVPAPGPKEKP